MILIAGRWRMISFSNSRLKSFSVGQMSTTEYTPWDIFFYISLSSTLFRGSNFFKKIGGLWYQFSQCSSCYEQHTVFLLKHSYYTVILCVFSEFLCAYIVFFSRKLIQRVSSFLVSLWFSSPSAVICDLLCLRTKSLNPIAIRLYIRISFLLDQGSK